MIPQPALGRLNDLTRDRLAPEVQRVDITAPTFSHPIPITNRLFPVSDLHSVVLVGALSGVRWRAETTLLPGTSSVDWNGQHIETLRSQFVAYLGGRIFEVAVDHYAQADDGSVWYLGEDVFDYEHGAIAFTEGTWLAGRDGPPAMIMPAHPKIGDTFRTENAPGVVFEEVTVKEVGWTVAGPRRPVAGAIVGSELHSDGTREDKIFAPGYGEFRTSGGGDLEALALAVPTDHLGGPLPAALPTLSTSAIGILESTRVGDGPAVRATLRHLNAAWQTLRSRRLPPLVAARLKAVVGSLNAAVQARRPMRAEQAAIDVALSTLDLELQYRSPAAIDTERFVLRTQQLRLDAARNDLAAVTGDVAVLEWIRDRIADTLPPAGRREIDIRLRALRSAADARNLPAAADHAARLASRLRLLTVG